MFSIIEFLGFNYIERCTIYFAGDGTYKQYSSLCLYYCIYKFVFVLLGCLFSISLLVSVFTISSSLFSSSSDLAWFMRECLTGVGPLCMDTLSCIHGVCFCAWTHFLAFMEWADDIGSRPAAWRPTVQSSSCSLHVFYRTLAVGQDTY